MDKLGLIMDCDCTMGVPGCDVDDSLALLYVLDCPEAELLGVTCSFGNNTQDTVYRNTKRLLKEWGREDIPVLWGADSPKERRSEAAEFMSAAARELGGGKARQSLLPEIADGEKYLKHIYDTYFNARVLKNP